MVKTTDGRKEIDRIGLDKMNITVKPLAFLLHLKSKDSREIYSSHLPHNYATVNRRAYILLSHGRL